MNAAVILTSQARTQARTILRAPPPPVSDFGLTHLADAKVRQAQRILAEKHRRWAETSLATLGRQNFDTLGTEELVNSGSPLLGDVEDASLGLL